jgi:hypothetical protein
MDDSTRIFLVAATWGAIGAIWKQWKASRAAKRGEGAGTGEHPPQKAAREPVCGDGEE